MLQLCRKKRGKNLIVMPLASAITRSLAYTTYGTDFTVRIPPKPVIASASARHSSYAASSSASAGSIGFSLFFASPASGSADPAASSRPGSGA